MDIFSSVEKNGDWEKEWVKWRIRTGESGEASPERLNGRLNARKSQRVGVLQRSGVERRYFFLECTAGHLTKPKGICLFS